MLTRYGAIGKVSDMIQGRIVFGKIADIDKYHTFGRDEGGEWIFWVSPEHELQSARDFRVLPDMHDRESEKAICFGQGESALRDAIKWGKLVSEASEGDIPAISYRRDIEREGIPIEVIFLTMQGRCAYLDLMGMPRARIAELADISRASLRQYISRFASVPDGIDI